MKYLYTIALSFLAFSGVMAQSYFTQVSESDIKKKITTERSIIPTKYQVTELGIEEIKHYLMNEVDLEDEGQLLYIMNPDGDLDGFQIHETRTMQDGLAAKYPGIKTYMGYHPDRKYERVYLGVSSTGFYATVSKPGATYAIDRYADKQDRYYISYYTKDHVDEGAMSHTCGTIGKELKERELEATTRNAGDLLPMREYRFAVATTGEFGAFYGPAKEDVLGELVKSVNRMNQVLENDFAVRLIIVDNNDNVIFTDADTDPYPDGNTGGILLGQNTAVLSNNIGFGNFDIGHVYTRGCDDTGGIARIESACTASKGAGVTCHYSNDITAMAIRVAAHEVGHQLGSNHTFNNCNGNENGGTAFEPGSGSTIMSYGGLCGTDLNVVNVANDYFHVSSIIEITRFTRELLGDNCPNKITTSNHIPDVEIPLINGFSIPVSTPFELEGIATDVDGDDLTYTWEQYNLGPQSVPGAPVGNSPLFISAYPSPSPKRVFPNMSLLLNNETDKREVLPSYERDMNFQFVVRDNNIESGGVAWEEIEFYVSESAGPFLLDFPSVADTFQVGEEVEILWDVANTDNDIVDCKSVNILLALDGMNYDIVLLEETPNDGSEKILVPNFVSTQARIKVAAADNIFFDISNEGFTIEEPSEPGFLFSYSPSYTTGCVPNDVSISFQTEGYLGFNETINFEVASELPVGTELTFSSVAIQPGESTEATITFADASLTGVESFLVRAYTTTDTLIREIVLDLLSTDFSDVQAVNPVSGSSGNVAAPVFSWIKDSDADSYEVRISDNPSFTESLSDILYVETVKDSFFTLNDILAKNTIYYWQVVAQNDCGRNEESEIYAFSTETISCNTYDYNDVPVGISQSGVIELNLPIDIVGDGEVRDVNILKVRGTHSWVSELKGELTSPDGTTIELFRNKCGNQSDYNAGFDDDAVAEITCPLNQGIFYQPEQPLDTFIGEGIAGVWNFTLTDTKIGNGGTLQEYKLEVCSNEMLEGPELVTNEVMLLPSGIGRRISSELLKTEDSNNEDEELTYTVVRLPANGTLRNEEDPIAVGSRFTQKDVNQKKIRYLHDGNSTDDSFFFTVTDGEGGWVSITEFAIEIDNDFMVDVDEVAVPEFQLYPNPAKDRIFISFPQYTGQVSVEIMDMMGRKVGSQQLAANGQVEVRLLNKVGGIFLANVRGEGFSAVRKFVVE